MAHWARPAFPSLAPVPAQPHAPRGLRAGAPGAPSACRGAPRQSCSSACVVIWLALCLPQILCSVFALSRQCAVLCPCLQVRLCSKLELLDRCLVKLRAGGHKVRAWRAGGVAVVDGGGGLDAVGQTLVRDRLAALPRAEACAPCRRAACIPCRSRQPSAATLCPGRKPHSAREFLHLPTALLASSPLQLLPPGAALLHHDPCPGRGGRLPGLARLPRPAPGRQHRRGGARRARAPLQQPGWAGGAGEQRRVCGVGGVLCAVGFSKGRWWWQQAAKVLASTLHSLPPAPLQTAARLCSCCPSAPAAWASTCRRLTPSYFTTAVRPRCHSFLQPWPGHNRQQPHCSVPVMSVMSLLSACLLPAAFQAHLAPALLPRPDWNPQMDKQAQARAHRLGQTKEVGVPGLPRG